jgi:hypothetical protein
MSLKLLRFFIPQGKQVAWYSGVIQKRAIAEKMYETLAIFSYILQCCFFVVFFLAQGKANLHVRGFIFTHSTQWPPQKAMKSHLF